MRTLEGLTAATRYGFSYDSGRLITITDRSGNVTTIERDASGTPLAIAGPFGQRTEFTVDANGFIASIANLANEATALTYTAGGLLETFTDPRGGKYGFSYDPDGRLLRDEDPAGGFSKLSRTGDPDDYTVKLTTAMNRTTSYQVQALAPPASKRINVDPSGLSTVEFVGAGGNRTSTSPDGTVTQLLNAPDPRFGLQTPIRDSFTVTTPGGLQLELRANRTATLADPNDPLSLTTLTDSETINGRTYKRTYNSGSKQLIQTSPMGRQAVGSLDTQGRPLGFQIAGLDAVNTTYDSVGRLETLTSGTGVNIRTMTFSYNSDGYVQTITDPLSRTVDFTYDSAGRVTEQISPDGRVTGYTYDSNGNIESITPPGRPAHKFSLTPVDLTTAYIPPDVSAGTNETHYVYNADRQLDQISRPDGQTLDFTYDSAGRPNTLTTPDGIFTYTYDATKGNLARIRAPEGISLTYTYDGPLLTGTTWTGPVLGSVRRAYDNNFRVTALALGSTSISFSYDDDGLLTRAGDLRLSRNAQHGLLTGTTLGRTTDNWTYNGFGEPTDYVASYSGSSVFHQNFTRDKLGRIIRKTETIAGITSNYDYTYDLAGRLRTVTQNGTTTATYEYDGNGNRQSVTSLGGTITGSYDDQDRLMLYGAAQYFYTANGELLSKKVNAQTTAYQYDALGNLKTVVLSTGRQIDYLIDGQNRRIGKKVGGTLMQGFLYQDGLKPIAQFDGRNDVVSRFVYATRSNVPDYLIKRGVIYRIFTDHLGSPRIVVEVAKGTIVQRMDYDEFGRVLRDSNPGFQPFGFAGGLYDRDTGLVRFGARDYDAETGRWTSKDPIGFRGGDTGLYVYAGNDSVNFVDRNGRRTVINIWTGMGSHASVYVDNGVNEHGEPELYDPGGDFSGGWKYQGEGILQDYREFHQNRGDPVQQQFVFNTTPEEERQIAQNFNDQTEGSPYAGFAPSHLLVL